MIGWWQREDEALYWATEYATDHLSPLIISGSQIPGRPGRRAIPMTDAYVLGGVRTPVGRYGVLGVCVGSGQGVVALVLENPKVR
jgi:hypothetical protein